MVDPLGPGDSWRLREVPASERGLYDSFVESHTRGHPLQLWSWGEVKRADGWSPLRFLLEHQGVPRAAVSVVSRRLFGQATFWLAHRGPVVHPHDRAAGALWPCLKAAAAARRAVVLRLDPEWLETDATDLTAPEFARVPLRQTWPNGALQPVRVWRIPLEGGLDAVFGRFEARTRRDVRVSSRRGVLVRPGEHRDLPAFYALEAATGRRRGFPVRSREFFDRLWQAWNEGGRGELHIAERNGQIVGGAWWLFCGQGAWGQFLATASEANAAMPAMALYWQGIRRAVERHSAFIDFGGIHHRDDVQDGLRGFKQGFGPGDTRFAGEFDLVVRPYAYRAFRAAEELRYGLIANCPAGLRRLLAGSGWFKL